MRTRFTLILPLLFALVSPSLLLAQNDSTSAAVCTHNAICCSNDASPAGVMISHIHKKNEWMFSYRFMRMNMRGIQSGGQSISNEEVLKEYSAVSDNMQMDMHMLMLMYGLTERLTLMGMFHYTSNYMKMTMPMGTRMHHHSMNTEGFSDIKISALYGLLMQSNKQLLLALGINIPVGSIQERGKPNHPMYPNLRFPYQMQLGSGTFDLLPTINYLVQKGKFTTSAQTNATLRIGKNTLGYRLGNEWNATVWSAWQWLSYISTSLRLEANVTGNMLGNDSDLNPFLELSANTANYGSKKIMAFVGSTLQFKQEKLNQHKLSVEFGLPLYQNFNGTQMPYKNIMTIAYAFNF